MANGKARRVVKKLDQTHLECRLMYSHPFDLVSVDDINIVPPVWGFPQAFKCPRCGTERLDIWDRLGKVTYRRYLYPEGYQVSADERPKSEDLRKEYMRRLK